MVLVFSLRILLAGSISPPCIASHKAGGRKKETVFFLSMLIPRVAVVKLGELCNYVDSYLKCSKFCVRNFVQDKFEPKMSQSNLNSVKCPP